MRLLTRGNKIALFVLCMLFLVGCAQQETVKGSDQAVPGSNTGIQEPVQQVEGETTTLSPGLGTLCSGEDECIAFCQNNHGQCEEYCQGDTENPLCQKTLSIQPPRPEIQPKLKPQSVLQESFYSEKQEKFEVFPVRKEDFLVPPKKYGLWPYGVRGINKDSHNEGHPGWDFELKKGSKLYAVADLRISQIHDGDKQLPDGSVIKVIETGADLKEGMVQITYHSVINIEKNVVEGATIKAGSVLAEVGYPLSDQASMIHFGIFAPRDRIGSCPANYFSKNLSEIIEFMVSNSLDQSTGKPYESSCVGMINKELYLKNYPEKAKYLEGGEPFE